MAINKWVIHTATGEFKYGGYYEPTCPQIGVDSQGQPIYDPACSIVTLPDEAMPDPRTQKWSNNAVTAKSAQEISNFATAAKATSFTATSRHKDTLATLGAIVRARNVMSWNNMTPAQKKASVLAEADVWVGIRQFIEDNL